MSRLLYIVPVLLLCLCGCRILRLPAGNVLPPHPALAATAFEKEQVAVYEERRTIEPAAVLPAPAYKIVVLEYPPGLVQTNYLWRLKATGNEGLSWFDITMDTNNTDAAGIVTIRADKQHLRFRAEGSPKR